MISKTFSEQENWKTTIMIRHDGYVTIHHKSILYPQNNNSIQLSPFEINELMEMIDSINHKK